MSLLEKAKEVKSRKLRKEVSREEAEVAVAFIRGELTSGQVKSVIGLVHQTRVFTWVISTIRMAYNSGFIKISMR